jgi:CDGSH-type Zn-finger protein
MASGQGPKILITKNGPYVVTGGVPLTVQVIGTDSEGGSWEWEEGDAIEAGSTYALCRCGESATAPFCDGSHVTVGFEGAETASRQPFDEQKTVFDGPALILEDARPLCAGARFCDTFGTTWDAMEHTDDPEVRERVIHQATRCPSGRLVVINKATGKAIEPALKPSIGVVQDPPAGCSGPLWVRGGIEVQTQGGASYEMRNRVTLCRCGQSSNKPFCDGSHITVGYRDGMD